MFRKTTLFLAMASIIVFIGCSSDNEQDVLIDSTTNKTLDIQQATDQETDFEIPADLGDRGVAANESHIAVADQSLGLIVIPRE